MRYQVPAKTFFVGEYLALTGGPAIVLTTSPSFYSEWQISSHALCPFHEASPAGRLWQRTKEYRMLHCTTWIDPYQGLGGLGASSAEFLSVYGAHCKFQGMSIDIDQLLTTYRQLTQSSVGGVPPSGYDVLAQSFEQCVFLYQREHLRFAKPWPFPELAFILVHTQKKLTTHTYLNNTLLAPEDGDLYRIALEAFRSFEVHDNELCIYTVKAYHDRLVEKNLVMPSSQALLKKISDWMHPLAAKGCGAMGADVLLFLVLEKNLEAMVAELKNQKYIVLSTSKNLYNCADSC